MANDHQPQQPQQQQQNSQIPHIPPPYTNVDNKYQLYTMKQRRLDWKNGADLVLAVRSARTIADLLHQIDCINPQKDNLLDSIRKISYYLEQDVIDALYYIMTERNVIVHDATANDTLTDVVQFKKAYKKSIREIQKRLDVQYKIKQHNSIMGFTNSSNNSTTSTTNNTTSTTPERRTISLDAPVPTSSPWIAHTTAAVKEEEEDTQWPSSEETLTMTATMVYDASESGEAAEEMMLLLPEDDITAKEMVNASSSVVASTTLPEDEKKKSTTTTSPMKRRSSTSSTSTSSPSLLSSWTRTITAPVEYTATLNHGVNKTPTSNPFLALKTSNSHHQRQRQRSRDFGELDDGDGDDALSDSDSDSDEEPPTIENVTNATTTKNKKKKRKKKKQATEVDGDGEADHLKSKEQQQPQNRSRKKRNPDYTLVIKNLSDNVKEQDILTMFQPFAVATKSRIVGTNLNPQKNNLVLAFVDYDCEAPVTAALKQHAETPFKWNGKVLEVDQKSLEQRTAPTTTDTTTTDNSSGSGLEEENDDNNNKNKDDTTEEKSQITTDDLLVEDVLLVDDPNYNNKEGPGYVSFDLYKSGLQLFYDGKYKESIEMLTKFCYLNGVSDDENYMNEDGTVTEGKGKTTTEPPIESTTDEPCTIVDEIYTENGNNQNQDENGMVVDTDYINISLCTITLCHQRPSEIREGQQWFNSVCDNAQENHNYNSQQHRQNLRDLYYYYQDFSTRVWYDELCYVLIHFNYGYLSHMCGVDAANGGNEKIQIYSLAIERDPKHVPSIYRRGLAYYHKKQYKEAKLDFESLLPIFHKGSADKNRDAKNITNMHKLIKDCDVFLHPSRKIGVHLKENEVDDIMKMFQLEDENDNDNDNKDGKSKVAKGGNTSTDNSADDENTTTGNNSNNNKKKSNKKSKSKKKKK
ncbi:hypothetical protein FRACYDRAFT_257211 [Fragilariopsis cylindrus CCMP1102]|uniref:RRM domain-containing protein n=1 Tax=Fragilariopsis cylindrus CCMP1102 TaxID=635003 RepID=A0A1E7EJA1_9STRA|nr:hypothetical protein FRACYDRAFT_257211 [Fragilariopsis cylindrus CCMP1102]|eukprot:OEU05965.1 hypothetical protein FRACYDRAFT_257211 [Fragilariopsis cylindrus CCMP1102]